jgi:hypothetical protein
MRECSQLYGKFAANVLGGKASGDGGMMDWIHPLPDGKARTRGMGSHKEAPLRRSKAPVRPGAHAGDSRRTPVEIKSTRARAGHPIVRKARLCAAYARRLRGGLQAVKPGDTEARASSPSGEGLLPSSLGPVCTAVTSESRRAAAPHHHLTSPFRLLEQDEKIGHFTGALPVE